MTDSEFLRALNHRSVWKEAGWTRNWAKGTDVYYVLAELDALVWRNYALTHGNTMYTDSRYRFSDVTNLRQNYERQRISKGV